AAGSILLVLFCCSYRCRTYTSRFTSPSPPGADNKAQAPSTTLRIPLDRSHGALYYAQPMATCTTTRKGKDCGLRGAGTCEIGGYNSTNNTKHTAMKLEQQNRSLVVSGVVLLLIATFGHATIPLYDGINFPDEPYRYADRSHTPKTSPPDSPSLPFTAQTAQQQGLSVVSNEMAP